MADVKEPRKAGRKPEPKPPKEKKDWGTTLATGEPKKCHGKPRVEIDLDVAMKLGAMNCTYAECSAFMDIPLPTLQSRPDFVAAFEKGKEQGKTSLRRLLYQHAQTSPGVTIFLSKNYLGLKDKPDEPEEPAAEVVIRMRPRKLADDTHNQDDDE